MKVTHTVKVPISEKYSMREQSFEADTSEFPQAEHLAPRDKMLYAQSELILQGLAFQVAIGYLKASSPEFAAAKQAAMALRPKELR